MGKNLFQNRAKASPILGGVFGRLVMLPSERTALQNAAATSANFVSEGRRKTGNR
jgi:hypothetical protein